MRVCEEPLIHLKEFSVSTNTIEQSSGNVYADLGMADAQEMLIKAKLAAKIGEIMDVPFDRPRNRAQIMDDPRYYKLRNEALDFLFSRFAHSE